jgi:hypothetical protein
MEQNKIKMTFGIQERHIKRINDERARWNQPDKDITGTPPDAILIEGFWKQLGREFGWSPFTLALHYMRAESRIDNNTGYRSLWDYLHFNHGLTLLESEVGDLVHFVYKFHPKEDTALLAKAERYENCIQGILDYIAECKGSSISMEGRITAIENTLSKALEQREKEPSYAALRAKAEKMEQALKAIEDSDYPITQKELEDWLLFAKRVAREAIPWYKKDGVTYISADGAIASREPSGEKEPVPQRGAVTTVYVPCVEDDPRVCGGFTSTDGQCLCYVRESNVPVIEQGAVWVKASERLPDHPDDPGNHFRLNGKKVNGNFYQDSDGMMFFEVRGFTHEPYTICWKSFIYLEWLDEGAGKEALAAMDDIIGFCEWIQENAVAQYEGGQLHSWRIFGPSADGKDYTTAQLWAKYKP